MIVDFFECTDSTTHDLKDYEYKINITNAIFNQCKNKLTLIFKLTNEKNQNCFLMKETMYVGSKKYRKIIRNIYAGDDSDIIAVDTEEFKNYIGKVKLKFKGDKARINWSTVSPVQSLLSEHWDVYHPEIYE